MEHYSFIERNEVLIHATMWMKLEYSMFMERSQNTKGYIFHLYEVSRLSNPTDETQIGGYQGLREGGRGCRDQRLNRYRAFFWG